MNNNMSAEITSFGDFSSTFVSIFQHHSTHLSLLNKRLKHF